MTDFSFIDDVVLESVKDLFEIMSEASFIVEETIEEIYEDEDSYRLKTETKQKIRALGIN